jgi:chorismate dehydratase
MGGPVRIGAVTYLNTKPLVYGLEGFAPHSSIVYDVPSCLARQLQAGQLDVALIPCIEYLKSPEYAIVSDACIACRGPVMSVKLYCRVPPRRITTLALDEGSRTSVVLARILLQERWGVSPRLEVLPLGAGLADSRADAVLLIGDRAIRGEDQRAVEVWDLGDQWCRWTELPFVFALWTARADADLQGVDGALASARDAGLAHLEEIAAKEAGHVGLDRATCLSYLRDKLYFRLGPRERLGLELFYQHAARIGLAPAGWELNFYGCRTAG